MQVYIPLRVHNGNPFDRLSHAIHDDLGFDHLALRPTDQYGSLRHGESARVYNIVPVNRDDAAEEPSISAYEEYRITSVVEEMNRTMGRDARRYRKVAPRIGVRAMADDGSMEETPAAQ